MMQVLDLAGISALRPSGPTPEAARCGRGSRIIASARPAVASRAMAKARAIADPTRAFADPAPRDRRVPRFSAAPCRSVRGRIFKTAGKVRKTWDRLPRVGVRA